MPRPLTPAERACLEERFRSGLDYRRLRVGALPLARMRRAVSPWGNLALFPRDCFVGAEPLAELDLARERVRRVLVHEAAHVWQRQRGRWVTLRALPLQIAYALGRDVYGYDRKLRDPDQLLALFLRSNVEQQAQMVEESLSGEPRWSGVLAHIRAT